MPALPCPECMRELQPHDLAAEKEFLVCAHCGRKIYERISTDLKLICPKCGEATDADYFHHISPPSAAD
jgi:DNA-directed RNA polymerase subunit RPC12/RpoP